MNAKGLSVQFNYTHFVIKKNIEGTSHEDSTNTSTPIAVAPNRRLPSRRSVAVETSIDGVDVGGSTAIATPVTKRSVRSTSARATSWWRRSATCPCARAPSA